VLSLTLLTLVPWAAQEQVGLFFCCYKTQGAKASTANCGVGICTMKKTLKL